MASSMGSAFGKYLLLFNYKCIGTKKSGKMGGAGVSFNP